MIKDEIKKLLNKHHSGEEEFHEAVLSVCEDLTDYGQESELLNLFERLIEPDRLIKFKVEWFDDDNILRVNRGYRVQFNNSLGPYKGGLRFHPSVNESVLKFLGFEQIFKNALTGLPMGGGKGGADFNPKGKSDNEIRRFCWAYMEELHKYIGAERDIPAGDIGVGVREIGYLFGQFIKLTGRYSGVLTGKHPNFGGSCGREEATGYGCVYFLEEALKYHEIKIENKRVSVSGAGNVALYTIEKLLDKNAKVLTLSDSQGTLYFKDGITRSALDKLMDLKFSRRGQLSEFSSSEAVYRTDKTPWDIPVDIAIPCATQNEINKEQVKTLIENGLECICEGANMPLTSEALNEVLKNNLIFLPGKAANAGGVAVSGFERSQNAAYWSLSKQEVDKKLQETMQEIHKNCLWGVEKKNGIVPYKSGANIYAFNKVVKTMKNLRG